MKRARARKPASGKTAKKAVAPRTGKKAVSKQTKYTYDDIDVPEILQKSIPAQPKPTQKRTSTKPVQRKPSKKKKKKNTARNVLLVIVFVILAAFLLVMGGSFGGGEGEGALVPVDMEKGKLNILVLGVDKEGLRTDAMMLVSYDMKNPGAKILSVPRDTQIKVEDRGATRKINEVHAMHNSDGSLVGPMGSIKAVSALTGVPIHYYIELNFDAIDELAEIIGPVEFDVPDIEGNGRGMNYDDPTQDLHIHLKPGLQKLKGNQMQQFLRYRKSNNEEYDGSDTSRVERQQEFLKAVIDQKVNLGLIAKLPKIFSKIKENMKTNFSAGDAVKYGKYLNGLTADALHTFSLPGEAKRVRAWYFFCDFEQTAELMRTEFDYPVDAEKLTNVINLSNVEGTKEVLSSSEKGEDSSKEQQEPVNDVTSDTVDNTEDEQLEEVTPEPEPEVIEPDDTDFDYEEPTDEPVIDNSVEIEDDVITLE